MAGSLVLRRSGGLTLPTSSARWHKAAMPIVPMPSAAADREHEQARRHPERETLELAAAGAAQVLALPKR